MMYQSGLAGHYNIIAQGIKVTLFSNLVRVSPENFLTVLSKDEKPLVLFAEKRFFVTFYQYLTNYRGFIFYAKSKSPLQLIGNVELIKVKSIWVSAYGS